MKNLSLFFNPAPQRIILLALLDFFPDLYLHISKNCDCVGLLKNILLLVIYLAVPGLSCSIQDLLVGI